MSTVDVTEAPRPRVDVGVVLAGRMEASTRTAVLEALGALRESLAARLPEFEWTTATVRRPEARAGLPADPMRLVDVGVLERDAGRWDFGFVVTELPLLSDAKPFMMGAPSQALDVAVLSTSRLRPHGDEPDRLRSRVVALMQHLFGHLNDVPHSDDPGDFMFDLRHVPQLDHMTGFSEAAVARLRRRLEQVADPRVEEREDAEASLGFYLRAAWPNRHEILTSVRRMRPWRFPLRYGRLTTAAVSALLVLIVTAEAWELGMSQPPWRVAVMSLGALMGTSYYVLTRQHLIGRVGHRPSEQLVVGSLSVAATVVTGMLTTYALLFGASWTAATLFFGQSLVRGWAASVPQVTAQHYLCLAGFVASAGMLTGALGASFEEGSYFRRMALLDEET